MSAGSSQPTMAVTIGDPAGVGPEIVLKALSDPEIRHFANWIVVGDRGVLRKTAATCRMDVSGLPTILGPTPIRRIECGLRQSGAGVCPRRHGNVPDGQGSWNGDCSCE